MESALREKLPDLTLLFVRDKGGMYSVPRAAITLQNVFRVMQEVKEAGLGIQYFTVSSLTLETVFVALLGFAEG